MNVSTFTFRCESLQRPFKYSNTKSVCMCQCSLCWNWSIVGMCAAVTSLPHSGHFMASWPRFAAVCSTLTQFKQNYLTIKYNKSPDDSPMTRTSPQLQTQSCCLTAAQSLDRSFWSLMSRRLFLSFDNNCRTRWRMEGRVREQGCASVSFPVK